MTVTYITSQILVILAYIFLSIGLRKKTRFEILTYSCIYQTLMIIQFILLAGTMGMIAGIIALCRNLLFIYNDKKNIENSKWVLALFCVISIILTVVFYKSIADIFPLLMTLIGVYIYWNKKTKVTRIGNITISACYIIYAFTISSWFSIICESYLVANTIYGYIKYDMNKNEKN